jgi:hypothetical protein
MYRSGKESGRRWSCLRFRYDPDVCLKTLRIRMTAVRKFGALAKLPVRLLNTISKRHRPRQLDGIFFCCFSLHKTLHKDFFRQTQASVKYGALFVQVFAFREILRKTQTTFAVCFEHATNKSMRQAGRVAKWKSLAPLRKNDATRHLLV